MAENGGGRKEPLRKCPALLFTTPSTCVSEQNDIRSFEKEFISPQRVSHQDKRKTTTFPGYSRSGESHRSSSEQSSDSAADNLKNWQRWATSRESAESAMQI
jgi:hypothetical protein